jgi:[acyl-carrier-protein] S-malonyltransferase
MNKIGLLFPGQGSQYVSMGEYFYNNFNSAKIIFEEANDALGFNLKDLCFHGSIEEITKTENTQPAILTVSAAIYKVYLEEIGIEPLYLAGHSIGEISAITCSEGIKFSDALKMVRKRGEIMQEALPPDTGIMYSINGLNKDVIEKECRKVSNVKEVVVISNYNSPEQIVISGHKEAVNKVCKNLSGSGAVLIPLKVSSAFHSPLMHLASEKFSLELEKYTFYKMKYPVISNVDALPYTNPEDIKKKLSIQIEKPVRWSESMDFIHKQGIDTVIEIGPKTTLKNLMKKNISNILSYAYDNLEDVKSLKDRPGKNKVEPKSDHNKFQIFINMCLVNAVSTRNQNWDNNEYEKGVIESYQRIKEKLNINYNESSDSSKIQMKEALELLKTIFMTKKVPVEEQSLRFKDLLEKTGKNNDFKDFI